MDRMSPIDASFLDMEDDINHMHVASCAIFEGPAPAYEDLVALFRSKLALVPRYRQKVRFVPGGLGRPVWVDDPHFKLDYHLRHTALPAPGDDDDLRNLMGRVMSQQLDRNRPLWETWIVEGLADGTWAMLSKLHHCMVDGVSGTDIMGMLLDADPEGSPTTEPDEWLPAPEPSDAEVVVAAMVDSVTDPAEVARRFRGAARTPRAMVRTVRDNLQGAVAFGKRLVPARELSVEGLIGPRRRWTWASSTMADVKTVRAAHGGTMNDVVLTAIAQGYRELLLTRGEDVEDAVLRTLVPVSLRAPGDTTPNNQVSVMIGELPLGISDPLERLATIRDQMVALKASHQADIGKTLGDLADLAPPALLSLSTRAGVRLLRRTSQRVINTVTTNVPGPRQPLYACGRLMTDYRPYVPLTQGLRTGVAILTYDGRISFGITGDWDQMPDLQVLADGIETGMGDLVAASRPKRRRTASS